MTVVSDIREVENCFDGSFIKEVELNEPLNEQIMHRMARGARLAFYPEFPRPYFRIERKRAFVVQGVLGNRVFRATLSRTNTAQAEMTLKELIQKEE